MLAYKYVFRKIVTALLCSPLLSLWMAWLNGPTENATLMSMMLSLLYIVVPIYLTLGIGSSILIDKLIPMMSIRFTVLRTSVKIIMYIIAAAVTYLLFLIYFSPSFEMSLIFSHSIFFRICLVGTILYSLLDAILTIFTDKRKLVSSNVEV
ncbi:MAG: hypothetical protein NAG76_18145 [Candidatus Pristimantibacillus lignocellulolyticus]|uniref:Uncharacterized protein n=1 Tax=Candidatus Pristimantibacillus lignocellulolyticus TaxID=2994561 RepID=A0A9J6ZD34_9BACL|nr:MAG: hypothetical protein NAG76_18145 [Candidatus Pristimantibacillus lignocellulolyticus]